MGAYAGQTIDQLREVARSALAAGNTKVIESLKAEMQLRIKRKTDQNKRPTPAQRDFLKELEGGDVATPQPKAAPSDLETPNAELERLRREVELWRSLYSATSESLVRWGLTSAMPVDILDEVADDWRKKLEGGPLDSVRTPEQFERDYASARTILTKGSTK